MSKVLKIILIFLIIVLAGAIGYYLLSGSEMSSAQPSSPLQTSTGQPVSGLGQQNAPDVNADQIGQEFLTQLLNIRAIKLREDIFSSPAFISLTDFTIELIQQGNEGRENPFAPFGIDVNPAGQEAGVIGAPGSGDVMFGPGSVTPTNPPTGPSSGGTPTPGPINNS